MIGDIFMPANSGHVSEIRYNCLSCTTLINWTALNDVIIILRMYVVHKTV